MAGSLGRENILPDKCRRANVFDRVRFLSLQQVSSTNKLLRPVFALETQRGPLDTLQIVFPGRKKRIQTVFILLQTLKPELKNI